MCVVRRGAGLTPRPPLPHQPDFRENSISTIAAIGNDHNKVTVTAGLRTDEQRQRTGATDISDTHIKLSMRFVV